MPPLIQKAAVQSVVFESWLSVGQSPPGTGGTQVAAVWCGMLSGAHMHVALLMLAGECPDCRRRAPLAGGCWRRLVLRATSRWQLVAREAAG